MDRTTMSPPEAPNSSSLLRWAGLFAVLAALAFFIDIQVAALCRDRCLGGEVGNLIRIEADDIIDDADLVCLAQRNEPIDDIGKGRPLPSIVWGWGSAEE